MKFIKSFFAFILSVALLAGTGIGCYYVVKDYILPLFSQKKQPIDTILDWNKLPKEFKTFSEKNALKIELPTMSNDVVIAGTAWSWYYKKNSNSLYDWYLMTNFHVVNETVAYTQDLTELKVEDNKPVITVKDPSALLDYYSKNTSTNIYKKNVVSNKNKRFGLKKFNFNNNSYSNLITYDNSFVEAIDIITDFNNDKIDLFSKSNGSVTEYNLDIALIKISMNFENHEGLLKSEYQRVNTFDNYLKNSYKSIKFDDNNNKQEANYVKTFIAGNPAEGPKENQRLIGTELSTNFELRHATLNHDDPVLSKLKAPYYYSLTNYKDFGLLGGSSGSAVYQGIDSNPNLDWTKIIPVGIYWGGRTYAGNNDNGNSSVFSPSLIPFIFESKSITGQSLMLNVFENFRNSFYQL